MAVMAPRAVSHGAACLIRCPIVGFVAFVVSGGSGARQFQQYQSASMVVVVLQLLQWRVMAVSSVWGYSMRETGLPSM